MRKPKSEVVSDLRLDEIKKKQLLSEVKIDQRCPRCLGCMPTKPCDRALNSIYKQGTAESQCDWFVVHADSNYCFFVYQHFNNKDHTLDEIANLVNSTIQVVDLMASRAIDKLKTQLANRQDLIELLEETREDGPL